MVEGSEGRKATSVKNLWKFSHVWESQESIPVLSDVKSQFPYLISLTFQKTQREQALKGGEEQKGARGKIMLPDMV